MNTLYAHDGYLNTFMRMRTEAAQREQGRRNWGKGARVPLVACVPSFTIFVDIEKRVGIENILLECPPHFWTFRRPWIVVDGSRMGGRKSVLNTTCWKI